MLIIQYEPEWLATTPCPKRDGGSSPAWKPERAAFCPGQAGQQNIWVDAKRETIAVLFRPAGKSLRVYLSPSTIWIIHRCNICF
ncbi:hypothetical protein AF333_02695 [Aneurinibacillus migulanus]|uniref:Uncharacterized protein n=1 Tax=Aneurinibacillus migulanus TaxID=47500 RepID=A0A0M0GYK9_ANEMI|nr:hypothetical protein AF333_02695 [Aneurinibacillus migulanus]